MKPLKILTLIIGLLSLLVAATQWIGRAAPRRLSCVQWWENGNGTFLSDAESGRSLAGMQWDKTPDNSIPFRPFVYGSGQPNNMPVSNGNYEAEIISTDFQSNTDSRLMIVNHASGYFHVFPDKGVRSFYWSPDGKRIAYLKGQGTAEDPAILTIVNTDGSNSRSATLSEPFNVWSQANLSSLTWSADGLYMAFASGQNGLTFLSTDEMRFVMSIASDEGYQIWRPPNFRFRAWSPQGHDMAYWHTDRDTGEIMLLVVSVPDQIVKSRIVLVRDKELFDVFQNWMGQLDWSPDGEYIASAFARNSFPEDHSIPPGMGEFRSDIYSLQDKAGASILGAFYNFGWQALSDGQWTPDGSAYVQTGERYTPALDPQSEAQIDTVLVAYLTKNNSLKTIATNVIENSHNPNINRIAYAAWEDSGRNRASVQIIKPDGTGSVTLLRDLALSPGVNPVDFLSWSPDGQYVAASGVVTSDDIMGTVPDTISDLPVHKTVHVKDAQLAWGRADEMQVHTLHYQLVHGLQWLPERHGLLYITEQNNIFKVMLLDLETGQSNVLLDGLTSDKYRDAQTRLLNPWTAFPLPDGQHVVLRYGLALEGEGSGYWHEGLYLTTWDGKDSHELYEGGFPIPDISQSPDGAAAIVPPSQFEDSGLLVGHNGQITPFVVNVQDNTNFAWTDCSLPSATPTPAAQTGN